MQPRPPPPAYARVAAAPGSAAHAPLLAPALDAQALDALSRARRLAVHQSVSGEEVLTCGCCEAPNSYAVLDADRAMPLFLAVERSDDVERCCCAPKHSLMLDVYALGPRGGRAAQLMTIEREGCCRRPLLGCPACCAPCADRVTVHAGRVDGRAGRAGQGRALLAVRQAGGCGACLRPTVVLLERGAGPRPDAPFATLVGPCCFGGCAELCCDAPFAETGGRASVAKLRPRSISAGLRELVSDADVYELAVREPGWGGPVRTAGLLAAALLLDYMLFERNGDALVCAGGRRRLNCCNAYCCGCVLPCRCDCSCPGSRARGGGAGGDGRPRPPGLLRMFR